MKTCFEEIRDKEGNDNMKGYSYSSAYEAPLGSLGMNKGTSVTPPTLTEEQSTIGHSLEQIKKRPYLKIFQLRNAAAVSSHHSLTPRCSRMKARAHYVS
jgi:hypothetical protein